jgi:hypothetical protein
MPHMAGAPFPVEVLAVLQGSARRPDFTRLKPDRPTSPNGLERPRPRPAPGRRATRTLAPVLPPNPVFESFERLSCTGCIRGEFAQLPTGYLGHVDARKRVCALSKLPLDSVRGTCDLIAGLDL